jgi:small conductance mechanosensitive channel
MHNSVSLFFSANNFGSKYVRSETNKEKSMDSFMEKFNESYVLLLEKLGGWLDTLVLNVPNIVIAAVVALMAFFLSKYVRKVTVKATKKITDNTTILNLISNLTSVIFTIVILFLILSIFNLSGTINKILATAGVLGLAVGLALQDPMMNLFSGVMMSVRKLYSIGDVVKTNGHFGVIRNIDLRSTRIRTPQGSDVVIPNKDVIQSSLENFTSSGERRVDVECGVSYGEDLVKVEKVAQEAISNLDGIIDSKPVDIMFSEFGGSSVNFKARFWIEPSSIKDYVVMKSEGIKAIKAAFSANDIMIPYPIRTLDFGIKGGVSLNEVLTSNEAIKYKNSDN